MKLCAEHHMKLNINKGLRHNQTSCTVETASLQDSHVSSGGGFKRTGRGLPQKPKLHQKPKKTLTLH